MIQSFVENIREQQLFSKEDKILIAVSGGMDSVCLSHLFAESGFSFGIAHCNFSLREAESDGDEAFVETLAKKLNVRFHTQRFDTTAVSKSQKISIQMAARELRYEWLEKIRKEHQYTFIATAHHLNDSIETMLYNFSKGCGIRGLHGILPKNGKIIRPFLYASRIEIENFIQEKGIEYREDASNASDKYSRNFIRHNIIPKLKELNPSFEKSASETIQKLRETEFLFLQSVNRYKKLVLEENGNEDIIHYKKLPKEAAPTLLYELLKPMGFNSAQINMILHTKHQSGASFVTDSHILLLDRDQFIIRKNEPTEQVNLHINEQDEILFFRDKIISFETLNAVPQPIPTISSVAVLDYDRLSFPLKIRPWKAGDIFQPFGMKGQHQKIQDFLTHKKLSRFEKEEIHVLESDGKICWVVGFRIDERFKVSPSTNKCFFIQLKNK